MSAFHSLVSFIGKISKEASTLTKYSEESSSSNKEQTANATADLSNLPNRQYWSADFATETFIDKKSGLLTSQTEGVNVPDNSTVYTLYAERAERSGNNPLYLFKENGSWTSKSAVEVLEDIRSVAKGLIHTGLKKGQTVAFMCKTSYEWNVFDAAVLAIGGIIATIYDTDSADQIKTIADNSDAELLVVETKEMYDKTDIAKENCPNLKEVHCFEAGYLKELVAYGKSISDEELDARINSIRKTDLCSIVYTSGSTAAPKGVELTHEQFLAFSLNLRAFVPDIVCDSDGSILMFLPQAHSFARTINYGIIASGLKIYIAGGINTLITDLQTAKPTAMIVVPRVLEKVYNAASQKAGNGLKGIVFAAAVNSARSYMKAVSSKGKAGVWNTLRKAVFDPLVYSALRKALGGRAKWIVSGGAPLDPALLTFFRGAGIPVFEGYGMTETTAPCAWTTPNCPFRAGTVGFALPGFAVRTAEDGELQVKGAGNFIKYHKNEEATKETFTSDGWIATGDLGRIDSEGFIYITGRKKDLIITAGGKNMSPGPVESIIQRNEIVAHALVLGDKRPFIAALITLEEESLRAWLASKGLNENMSMEEACENAAVRAFVQKSVDEANDGVSRAESVRKFVIVPEDFSQENGLLTPSMKVMRPKVLKRYAKLIDNTVYGSNKK